MWFALLKSCGSTGHCMALSKVGIPSAKCSPVGSLETLGKNRSASDFSIIRQKGDGVDPGAA